jgi:hypothetical protein
MVHAGDDGKAKIVTGTEKPADCISSVHVNSIDGEQVYVQPLGFEIEAGTHSLTGRAVINATFCRSVGTGSQRNKVEPLEAEFEAGKTYYIGYDHSAGHQRDWKLVIWKTEGGEES